MAMDTPVERPTAPIFDVDEAKDLKTYWHNVAYKTNRVVINLEKMKVRVQVGLALRPY